MPKKLPGRPKKPDGEKYKTTARMLGRVPDAEWARLRAATASLDMTFTKWAVPLLLAAADALEKSQKKKRK